MNADVRWGFLGAGGIATRNAGPATHWAAGASLFAAAARDPARAAVLQPRRVHVSYQDLLDDPNVDAVYISLANDAHLPWTLAALRAGKHVLCEKPLGLTAAQVRKMASAAVAADRLLVEAFWYRWHPRTRRLAALLAAGDLGAVTSVDAMFAYGGPADGAGQFRFDPAAGGGALYDVGAYTLSGLHLALGPSVRVTGAVQELGPSGVDLRTTATVTSAGGAQGRMTCGLSGPPGQHFVVTGTDATVRFAPADQIFASWMTPTALDFGTRTEQFPGDDPYRIMVEHVSAAIRGKALAPTGEATYLHPLSDSLTIAITADAIRTFPPPA